MAFEVSNARALIALDDQFNEGQKVFEKFCEESAKSREAPPKACWGRCEDDDDDYEEEEEGLGLHKIVALFKPKERLAPLPPSPPTQRSVLTSSQQGGPGEVFVTFSTTGDPDLDKKFDEATKRSAAAEPRFCEQDLVPDEIIDSWSLEDLRARFKHLVTEAVKLKEALDEARKIEREFCTNARTIESEFDFRTRYRLLKHQAGALSALYTMQVADNAILSRDHRRVSEALIPLVRGSSLLKHRINELENRVQVLNHDEKEPRWISKAAAEANDNQFTIAYWRDGYKHYADSTKYHFDAHERLLKGMTPVTPPKPVNKRLTSLVDEEPRSPVHRGSPRGGNSVTRDLEDSAQDFLLWGQELETALKSILSLAGADYELYDNTQRFNAAIEIAQRAITGDESFDDVPRIIGAWEPEATGPLPTGYDDLRRECLLLRDQLCVIRRTLSPIKESGSVVATIISESDDSQ